MSEKFEVKSYYGVLGTKKDKHGEPTEVRLCKVSWYGSAPMWDLRIWDKDEKPGKGMTLTTEMLKVLRDILDTEILE